MEWRIFNKKRKKPKIKKRVQQPQQRVLNLQRNRKFLNDLDCL